MDAFLKFLGEANILAKEPPRQNMLYRRLLNQLIDPDLAIARGAQTLEDELDREVEPSEAVPSEASSREASQPAGTKPPPLPRPSLEVQLVLATWDLSRRVDVDITSVGEAKLLLDGSVRAGVMAPSEEDLSDAVDDLIVLMKHPVCLDEIIFESDGLDLAFPLLCEIWKVSTLQVLDVVTNVVSVPVHVIKHHLNVERPSERDCRVVPLIPVPGHASFPGGHAATTYALAVVLGQLMKADKPQQAWLNRIARRISRNRERAGLHTRLDTNMGKELGRLMGYWMIEAAQKAEFKQTVWGQLFAKAAGEWTAK